LRELFRGSVTNQIIRQSKHIDVFVVTGAAEPFGQEKAPVRQSSHRWWGYLLGLGTVIGATLLGILVHTFFDPANLIMLYLLSVVISAIYFGLGPSILASVLGVLTFDFFFVPPSFTFAVADTQYIFTFIALLAVGIVVSYLTAQVRNQIETARRHEAEMATLYDLSKDIAATVNLETTINAIINHVEETLGLTAAIFIPDTKNKGNLKPYTQKRHFDIDENDAAVAFWTYQHQQTAGFGTDTLQDNKARYFPLNTTRGAVGVMGIWLANTTQPLTIEQTRLLEAFANLAAMGIERAQLKG
jgi:two-component system sensor histidine kinase KdpD